MAQELQLVQHQSGFLFPATPESREFLQSNCKPGAVLVAEFTKVRNPTFHRKYFALLNLGFEYWQPGGGAISSNERKLVQGYAKCLMTFGGDETEFQQLYKASLDVLRRWILSRTFQMPAQADELLAQYRRRGVPVEPSLNPDYKTWTVSAWLPENKNPPRTDRRWQNRVLANIWLQCSACNVNKSGNIEADRVALVEPIGEQHVQALETNNETHRYTREELAGIRADAQAKLRPLKKQEAA